MQADAYAGFAKLYEADRKGGPIIEAACWAHARRKFFDLAIDMVPSCAGHICLTRKRRCGTVICSSEIRIKRTLSLCLSFATTSER